MERLDDCKHCNRPFSSCYCYPKAISKAFYYPNLTFVPIAKVTDTAVLSGTYEVYRDYWWTVYNECIILFKKHSPQCNRDHFTASRLQARLHPYAECRQIPLVFLRHNCNDYI